MDSNIGKEYRAPSRQSSDEQALNSRIRLNSDSESVSIKRHYSIESIDQAGIALSFADIYNSNALDLEEEEKRARKQRQYLRKKDAASETCSVRKSSSDGTQGIEMQPTNIDRHSSQDEENISISPIDTIEVPSTAVSDGTNTQYEKATWYGMLMFTWLNDIIELGSKKILDLEDVYLLPKMFSSKILFDKVIIVWNEEYRTRGKDAKVLRVLWKCFSWNLILCIVFNLPYIGVILLQPYFVLHLLEYITTSHTYFFGTTNGVGLAALLGIISFVSAFAWSLAFYFNSLGGMQVRGALIALIFDKSLRLSSGARGKHTTGEIMTLMSADVERMWQATLLICWLWIGPFIITAAIILLYFNIGISALAGAAALICINCVQTEAGNRTGNSRRKLVAFTEERVKITNELLQGIRVVKYYAWELPMREKVTSIREQEVSHLSEYQFYKLVNSLLQLIGPALVSFALFICFVQTGGILTIPKVYTAYAFLNLIRMPLSVTPMAYSAACEAKESLRRICKFLMLEEIQELNRIGPDATNAVPSADAHKKEQPPSLIIHSDTSSASNGVPVSSIDQIAKDHRAVVVEIKNCTFSWGEQEGVPTDLNITDKETHNANSLSNISVAIKEGEFVAVVGSVGSGKSSLMAALLGQMHRCSGQQYLKGKVSYVSQEHWIQNMTLMENVIFGAPMNENWYAQVLEVSQLSRDLENLPHGDYTSIGERGINLSGGQKARVSIARALYRRDSDIYIFDDSLAAVDVHVGAAIFENALQNLLQNKTRIVVLSSNYHLLPHFDRIIVMKDGAIASMGTLEEILLDFPQYSSTYISENNMTSSSPEGIDESGGDANDDHADESQKVEASDAEAQFMEHASNQSKLHKNIEKMKLKRKNSKLLMTEEDREKGAVTLATFVRYFESALYKGWGGPTFFIVLFLFSATQLSRVISDIWVGQWAQRGQQGNHVVDDFYQNWYIALVCGTCGLAWIRGWGFIKICIGASKSLHANLLLSILRAPINTYFDVTPMGRIINRFSKDLDNMDSLLPDFFHQNLQNGFVCLFIIIVCVTTTPFMLILLVPTAYAFYRIQSYFRKTSREMKRLDAISRSPMYSLFSEVLQGLQTIRAFDKAAAFKTRFFELSDQQARNFFVFYFANRWLAIRLDLVSNCVLLSVALLTTGIASAGNVVDGNYLGLALVYSLQLTGLLQWTVRIATETETNMTSVERLLAFNNIPPEEGSMSNADWIRSLCEPDKEAADPMHKETGTSSYQEISKVEERIISTTTNEWPNCGEIHIHNLSLRYRPELGLVLRNLSLRVPAGKRVGICGRTGAGKSSLMLALFRIVTFEPGSSVIIDGKDICQMSLFHLRSHLTIIPQDPVMFSGTLRTNLDPFNHHTEAELWGALERVHLKEDILLKFPMKLDHEVSEQGGNISVGQRQLMCIARALLRKSKIIVMDEATASVDSLTDQRIQTTIRNEFNNCTVLTIAHRLETIADYDLVAVLDNGKVVEYGSPQFLLNCPPEQMESHDPDVISKNQADSAVRSRGLFLDLVNGLGTERKAAIFAIARDREYQSSIKVSQN